MNKGVIAVVLCLLVLLTACGSKTTGRRVALPEGSGLITGAAIIEDEPETSKTAAEVLRDLQESPTSTQIEGAKSGTFYPPVVVTGSEREALKQKTRALFTQPTYDPNVEAEGDFGAKYHESDGDPTNLPEDYSDNSGD